MQDMITDKRMCNIQMVKGDTLSFGVRINGLGQDLESSYFTCKQNYSDATNKFQKSIGDGIEKVTTADESDTRFYRVRVAPADTADLEAGRYYYDFKIGVNGDVFTVLLGVLDITQNVGV